MNLLYGLLGLNLLYGLSVRGHSVGVGCGLVTVRLSVRVLLLLYGLLLSVFRTQSHKFVSHLHCRRFLRRLHLYSRNFLLGARRFLCGALVCRRYLLLGTACFLRGALVGTHFFKFYLHLHHSNSVAVLLGLLYGLSVRRHTVGGHSVGHTVRRHSVRGHSVGIGCGLM